MNVLAVERSVASAVGRARAGQGPTFIEAVVYRLRAHGGSGDDSRTGYRAEAERQAWEPFCPIAMFGEFLTRRGDLAADAIARMEREISAEIAAAFDAAIASPEPVEADLSRHVYAD
jgi:TPP-dependent pyruvate/acetoin dehydrogenase alpha subunit